MPSRSPQWERIRTLEDAQALLDRVDEHRRVIRHQAWHEASFDAIYEEATAMTDDLARFKATLSARWHELFDQTQEDPK